MTPQQIEANVARFNEAAGAADAALAGIKQFQATNDIPDDLARHLEAYTASVSVMIETSAELIGVTGPLAPRQG